MLGGVTSDPRPGDLLRSDPSRTDPSPTDPSPTDPRRPVIHLTPERGFMNDPNGLVQHRGTHHLFFQHNPDEAAFGLMRWGHAASEDLLHWRLLPTAFEPGAEGGYDRDGCWSGVHVSTPDGPAVLYTGREGDAELPCLAYATDDDLVGWRRHPGNPLLAAPPEPFTTAFRDHVVWPVPGGWRQLVGGATADRGGAVFAFRSADLLAWDYEGVLLDATAADLPTEVWECPDLFLLGDRPVLVVSLMDGADDCLWVMGEPVDDVAEGPMRFVPAAYGRMDLERRFYAAMSYRIEDGRRVGFGWLREQHEPDVTQRSRIGVMSLPRVIDRDGDRLVQRPAEELAAARGTVLHDGRGPLVTVPLDGPLDGVPIELELTQGGPGGLPPTTVTVTGAGDRAVVLDLAELAGRPVAWQRVSDRWHPVHRPVGAARLVVDRGVLEVFLDHGACAAWTRTDLDPVTSLEVRTDSRVAIKVYEINDQGMTPGSTPTGS